MLTVTVGFVGSGNRRTESPFASRYSVIPSTVATLTGAGNEADGAGGGALAGAGAVAAACAVRVVAAKTPAAKTRKLRRTRRIEFLLGADVPPGGRARAQRIPP